MSIQTAMMTACTTTEPFTKARRNALAKIKWVIADDAGHYLIAIEPGTMKEAFTGDKSQATVYDGCDNENTKLKFFTAITKRNLHVEMI